MLAEKLQRRLRGAIEERKLRVGQVPKLPVYSVTNSGGIQGAEKTFSKQVFSRELANYKVVRRGWYAYNPSRIDVGSLARNNLEQDGCLSPFYTVFELVDPSFDPEYFRHFVFGRRFNERVNANLQGSVRDVLTFGALEAFPIHLPPLAEQQAVAHTLKAVEATIDETKALLDLLVATKRAVMRELLTKGTRRNRAPMRKLKNRWVLGRVTEGVEAIPADWELVRLTSVAKLESGHTPSRKVAEYWDGNIPWISLQDAEHLGALTINSTRETFGPEGLANSSARLLPAGTVVLQRTANIGLCSIMAREMTTSQHFANWVCGPKIAPEYLLQVFRHMGREWKRLDAGSVLPDIYMPTFKKLQVLLPPLEEQQKIAEVGAAFDLRIEAEKRALAELQNTRKALAQELLSGRIRLPKTMIERFEEKAVQAVSA